MRSRKKRISTIRHTLRKRCQHFLPNVPSNSKHINPGTDFFKYINNNWLKHAKIAPFRSSIGVSQEIQEQIDKKLLNIINESRSKIYTNEQLSVDRTAIGRFAESVLRDKYQNNNIQAVNELLLNINCMRNEYDIAKTLGELCHTRTLSLLNIYAGPEEYHSNHWRLHISPGNLGLPHAAYYTKKAPGGNKAIIKYSQILNKAGELFNIPQLEEFSTLEAKYAPYIDSAMTDIPKTVKGKRLVTEYKNIPWDYFWLAYGLNPSQWKTMKFVIDSEKWLHHLNSMFRDLNILQWKKIFQGCILIHFLDILPPPFDDMHYLLYSKLLKGEKQKVPQDKFMLAIIKLWLTVPLSREYMKCCMSYKTKKEIHRFTKTIFKAAEARIRQSWLEKNAKKEAVQKIRKIKSGIMYPDTKFNYTVPELMSDNLVKNILLLGASRSDQELRDVQNRYSSQTWENPVFMVNAFYLSAGNHLVLPAGIVQWPFYCSEGSIGWNYGGLGAVIGHELTHAFDTDGKLYDSEGNKRDWWSDKDDHTYNKKAKQIILFFSKAKIHGHYLDPINTLMENIADLGGLAMSLDALNEQLDKLHMTAERRNEEYRSFFKSFAVSWREKNRKESEIQQLLIDSHSPPELRVNLIVPHFQEWYDAYNIKQTDPMYILPEKRIVMF